MNGTGATTGATTGKAEPRADLLALTPDTLAALANRGLVKRAAKELESSAGPEVDRAADGTVSGRHPDGTLTELPPGLGLDAARCSCGAAGDPSASRLLRTTIVPALTPVRLAMTVSIVRDPVAVSTVAAL